MIDTNEYYEKLIQTLNQIGIALSAEKDNTKLLEMILEGAMKLTHADAGTIYLVYKKTKLNFAIIANKSLNIKPSHIFKTELPVTSVPLYVNNQPNLKNVVTACYHQNKTLHIPDVYHAAGFDFAGTFNTDERLHYHSQSMLTVPLINHEQKVIGILQLINAVDENTGVIIPFTNERILFAESLASQAATILTKQELIDAQKKLFEALLQLIAKAIDEKSNYTSNHCSRVPILTMMLANALNQSKYGIHADFHFTKDQMDELIIAAWLHDCGKIVTPDYVMNKATKLETLSDRIEVINLRFEMIKRDMKIDHLEQLGVANEISKLALEGEYKDKIARISSEQAFINKVNTGGEFLSDADKERIKNLAKAFSYHDGKVLSPLLSPNDIENLCISKGTLNDEERHVIENHVVVTQTMLQSLPYPEYLKNVPEIAGSHHERMDGKGYPHGKDKKTLSIQARILTIADIFEALSSADRPYKTAKTLKEVLSIMENMKNSGHIDPDLYDIFVKEKIYLIYAKQYLNSDQIDV